MGRILNAPDGPIGTAEGARLLAPLDEAKRILLAVSGGPDSLALMLLAAAWTKAKGRPPVHVATVDHGYRPEAKAEAAGVAAQANALGLPHSILTRSGPVPKTRLQERAREARYRLLAQEAKRVGASHLVTGHHADDQAETVLFRLMRGSGPAGLAGMAGLQMLDDGLILARPLLGVPKTRLIATCKAAGLHYVTDPSNADPRFARTHLRALAPALAAEGLDRDALLRLARRAARAENALAAAEQSALAGLRREPQPDGLAVSMADLQGMPEEIGLRVLAALIRSVNADGPLRLERLERLGSTFHAAFDARKRCTASLAGTVLTYDGREKLTILREKPRMRGRTVRR